MTNIPPVTPPFGSSDPVVDALNAQTAAINAQTLAQQQAATPQPQQASQTPRSPGNQERADEGNVPSLPTDFAEARRKSGPFYGKNRRLPYYAIRKISSWRIVENLTSHLPFITAMKPLLLTRQYNTLLEEYRSSINVILRKAPNTSTGSIHDLLRDCLKYEQEKSTSYENDPDIRDSIDHIIGQEITHNSAFNEAPFEDALSAQVAKLFKRRDELEGPSFPTGSTILGTALVFHLWVGIPFVPSIGGDNPQTVSAISTADQAELDLETIERIQEDAVDSKDNIDETISENPELAEALEYKQETATDFLDTINAIKSDATAADRDGDYSKVAGLREKAELAEQANDLLLELGTVKADATNTQEEISKALTSNVDAEKTQGLEYDLEIADLYLDAIDKLGQDAKEAFKRGDYAGVEELGKKTADATEAIADIAAIRIIESEAMTVSKEASGSDLSDTQQNAIDSYMQAVKNLRQNAIDAFKSGDYKKVGEIRKEASLAEETFAGKSNTISSGQESDQDVEEARKNMPGGATETGSATPVDPEIAEGKQNVGGAQETVPAANTPQTEPTTPTPVDPEIAEGKKNIGEANEAGSGTETEADAEAQKIEEAKQRTREANGQASASFRDGSPQPVAYVNGDEVSVKLPPGDKTSRANQAPDKQDVVAL